MGKREQVELTNLCMVTRGTKVLVEDKVSRYGSGIIFPGGHVEPGEPIVDSVIREVREETGLTIESPRLMGIKDWVNEDGSRYLVFLFAADRFTGTLQSSQEGSVYWVERDEVLQMPWIWHMDRMMQILTGGGFSELFLDTTEDWKPLLK